MAGVCKGCICFYFWQLWALKSFSYSLYTAGPFDARLDVCVQNSTSRCRIEKCISNDITQYIYSQHKQMGLIDHLVWLHEN